MTCRVYTTQTAYEAVRGYVVYEQPTQPRCTADVNMDGDLLDPHTAIGFIVPEYDDLNNTRIANDVGRNHNKLLTQTRPNVCYM